MKRAHCSAENVCVEFFLIINNVNTSNKPENAPDLMVAVRVATVWYNLKLFVFGPRDSLL